MDYDSFRYDSFSYSCGGPLIQNNLVCWQLSVRSKDGKEIYSVAEYTDERTALNDSVDAYEFFNDPKIPNSKKAAVSSLFTLNQDDGVTAAPNTLSKVEAAIRSAH